MADHTDGTDQPMTLELDEDEAPSSNLQPCASLEERMDDNWIGEEDDELAEGYISSDSCMSTDSSSEELNSSKRSEFLSLPIPTLVQGVTTSFISDEKVEYEWFKIFYPRDRLPDFVEEMTHQACKLQPEEQRTAACLIQDLVKDSILTIEIVIEAVKVVLLVPESMDEPANGVSTARFLLELFDDQPDFSWLVELVNLPNSLLSSDTQKYLKELVTNVLAHYKLRHSSEMMYSRLGKTVEKELKRMRTSNMPTQDQDTSTSLPVDNSPTAAILPNPVLIIFERILSSMPSGSSSAVTVQPKYAGRLHNFMEIPKAGFSRPSNQAPTSSGIPASNPGAQSIPSTKPHTITSGGARATSNTNSSELLALGLRVRVQSRPTLPSANNAATLHPVEQIPGNSGSQVTLHPSGHPVTNPGQQMNPPYEPKLVTDSKITAELFPDPKTLRCDWATTTFGAPLTVTLPTDSGGSGSSLSAMATATPGPSRSANNILAPLATDFPANSFNDDTKRTAQVPSTSTVPATPQVSAMPPTPPNWEAATNCAVHNMAPYLRLEVAQGSAEYRAIADLLEPPLGITKLERIVNVEVWRRFCNMRKEMLIQKSADMGLLASLGLTDTELSRRAHVLVNFPLAEHLKRKPYNDNMVLLFHCTRGDVDKILYQGLDERLSNSGNLGRGIYFAHDPLKSIQYDHANTLLIFGVLLGDCLDMTRSGDRSLVREPEKSPSQRRNPTDGFFDSLVARPHGSHEYVIYNRNQCCPLYTVKYDRVGSSRRQATSIPTPPFIWSAEETSSMGAAILDSSDEASSTVEWPLLARVVFEKMQADDIRGSRVTAPSAMVAGGERSPAETIDTQLQDLNRLGFTDDAANRNLLEIFNYNFDQTLDCLLEGAVMPNSGTQPRVITPQVIPGAGEMDRENEMGSLPVPVLEYADCLICFNNHPKMSSYWKKLDCTHEVCYECFKKLEKSAVTMSGEHHTFIKCPFCLASDGMEIGSCPDGNMTVSEIDASAAGYEDYTTLQIRYFCPGPVGVHRTAYLPNSPEGKDIVELLKIAWDRRLTFTLGTSATTGQEETLVWNIHHKTGLHGGVQVHSYPDPTYLIRVQQELAQYGIGCDGDA